MRRCSPLNIVCVTILIAVPVAVSLDGQAQDNAQGTTGGKERKGCDQDNGGLTLPPGFCASVFADNLGRARHLTVAPGGDVYVNTWSSAYTDLKNAPGGYIVALRDTNRDGKADQVERFGPVHQDGRRAVAPASPCIVTRCTSRTTEQSCGIGSVAGCWSRRGILSLS